MTKLPLSGVIEQPFRTYYRLRIEWSQAKDTVNNRSTVTCNVYVVSTSGNWGIVSAALNTSYSIDGYNGSFTSNSFNNPGGQKTFLGSFSRIVAHNSDGYKNVSISVTWPFRGTIGGVYINSVTASGTASLDPIPRASQPTLSKSNIDLGSSVVIYTNRPSGTNFTHTLKYIFGYANGTIATGVTDSYTWNLPLSLANQMPNGVLGYGSIICETYNGSTLIGTKKVDFTANVPSSVVPTISLVNHEEHIANVKNKVGAYVQRLSRITFTINASGAYGSTIKSYEIYFEGQIYYGRSITTNTVNGSGSLKATAKVIDSRGRVATKDITVSILPYSPPYITGLSVVRTNSNGTPDPLGTYAKVILSGTFTPLVVSSSQKNKIRWIIYSKERGADIWNARLEGNINSGNTISINQIVSGYEAVKSYDFMVGVLDEFNAIWPLDVLSSGEVAMSWSKTGVGIGKVWEKGSLDVGGDAYITGELNIDGGLFYDAAPLPSGDSTKISYWTNIKSGKYRVTPNTLLNQPSLYGLVEVSRYGGDFNVLWFSQPNGPVFRLSGNLESITTWIKIDNGINYSRVNANLQNGWSNYGNGYTLASYWREGDTVFITGLVVPGTLSSQNAIFQLPTGFRPPSRMIFNCKTDNGYQRIDVNVEGNVLFVPNQGSVSSFLSLAGISFRID